MVDAQKWLNSRNYFPVISHDCYMLLHVVTGYHPFSVGSPNHCALLRTVLKEADSPESMNAAITVPWQQQFTSQGIFRIFIIVSSC